MTFALETASSASALAATWRQRGVVRVRAGTLTAIVGPNGAGKTTYFNLISGQLRASAGRVFLHGEDLSSYSAPRRSRRGIGRAFQLTNLFPNLSCSRTSGLRCQSRAGLGSTCGASEQPPRTDRACRGGAGNGRARRQARRRGGARLAHGEQRKLEVGILMALEPTCFMFDEPTAA